jgi:hypothetical protein
MGIFADRAHPVATYNYYVAEAHIAAAAQTT